MQEICPYGSAPGGTTALVKAGAVVRLRRHTFINVPLRHVRVPPTTSLLPTLRAPLPGGLAARPRPRNRHALVDSGDSVVPMPPFRVLIIIVAVILQLPCIGLWWFTRNGVGGGSQNAGAMALVLPAIICGSLWLIGGLTNLIFAIIETVRCMRGGVGMSTLLIVLGGLTAVWVAVTLYFLLR